MQDPDLVLKRRKEAMHRLGLPRPEGVSVVVEDLATYRGLVGEMVFCTKDYNLYVYDGKKWRRVDSAA